MTDCVSDQVNERVTDDLEDIAINFSICTYEFEVYFFAILIGGIADDAVEFIEEKSNLDESDIHYGVLEIGGYSVKPCKFIRVLFSGSCGDDAVTLYGQFAHQVQQVIEFA